MNFSNEENRLFAESIMDTIHESLIVLDKDLKIVSANRSFYRKFQTTPEQTEGHLIFDIGNRNWDIPEFRKLLEKVIPDKSTIEDFEVRHSFEPIGDKVMLLNARCLITEQHRPELILLAIEDVTEKVFACKKLVESEAKFHRLVEQINSIIIGFDREGQITYFNHFSEKLFGYKRQEVIGKPFVGIIIPVIDSSNRDNSSICKDIFSDPDKYYQNESEGVRKDGSRILFSWSARALYDSKGAVCEILIDGNDITDFARERKEAEENASILNALLEFIPEGIMITDEKHKIQRVSKYMGEIFGISLEKLFNTDEQRRLELLDLHWPDGEKLRSPGDLPLSKSILTGKTMINVELVLHKNGYTKFLSVSAAPVRDIQGRIIGAVGGWRDITALRRSMMEVEERKRVLEALMKYAPIGIILADRTGVITDVSRFQTELLGIQEDDIIGKEEQPEKWQVLEPATRKALHYHFMPLCQAIRRQLIIKDQEFLLARDKEEKVVSLSAGPVLDEDGNVIGGVAIWSDITENKQLMRAITDLAKFPEEDPLPVLRLTSNGLILYGNKASKELLAGLQCHINSVIPESWRIAVKEVFSSNSRKTIEATCLGRVLSFDLVPVSGQGYINVYAHDITRRRAAEDAMRKALEKAEIGDRMLNALMDNVPEGISICDNEGILRMVSKHGQDLLGDIHVGMSIDEIVKKYPVFIQDGKTAMPFNELPLVRAINGETVRDVEIIEENSYGRKLPLLCNAAPIRDSEGHVVNGVLVWRDIITLKKAEQELQESYKRFATAFRAIPDALVIADMKTGVIIDVNETWVSHWGYSIEQSVGRRSTELGIYSNINDRDEFLKILRQEGRVEKFEIDLRTADGELRNALLYIEKLKIPHKSFTLTIIHDITERKRTEKQVQKYTEELAAAYRDLESFSYSVSHDLKNPLSTISGFVGFLLEDYYTVLDAEGQFFLKKINEGIKKMQALINDILKLSLIDRQELALKEVNLSAVVGDYAMELKNSEPGRKAEIVIEDNVHTFGDPGLIQLALENLLRNAWKFTSHKEISRIEFGTKTVDNRTVYFVSDNGIGFDMKYQEKIFKPFQRGHTEKQFSGTGVGLSIVQRVIVRHGGKIWAEGKVGEGATFYFTLTPP